MRVNPKYVALSCAFLLAAIPALANGETSSATVSPAPVRTAVIRCPGVTNVPVTADQEQALPLNIVSTLSCGDLVQVLSNQDSYTVQVRTRDGVVGYVAQIYLAERPAPKAVKGPAPSARPVNGVVRWASGATGCDEFLSQGRHVESVSVNGMTVQVSLQDSGWKYRANLAVSNQSGATVEVLPGIITLAELAPISRALLATDTQKLENAPTHQIFWTLADATPSSSAMSDSSARMTEEERLENRNSPAPDYLDSHLALASTHHVIFERTENLSVHDIILKPGNLPSGQITAGVMWFERDASARELSLRVPVGNLVFEFPFSLAPKK
jgi:hypothetical protein